MRILILSVLVLGIAVRGADLGKKFYWVDEVHTSLRISGYTKADIAEALFDGRILEAEQLQGYLVPTEDTQVSDAIASLIQHPEHPPLYYLLARFWVQALQPWWQDSVAVLRSLSVVFGLAVLPGVYWLGRELFPSRQAAGWAMAIAAISPLHILYAQEARQYSLWTLMIVLSSAALVRAVCQSQWRAWALYGITLVIGLYTHYLFTLVALGHGIYSVAIVAIAQFEPKHPSFQTLRHYLVTALLGVLTFMPWIIVTLMYRSQLQNAIDATQRGASVSYLLNVWFRNLNRVFFSTDLATFNLLLVLLTIYALYVLWHRTPIQVWLLVMTLIGTPATALVIGDVITGSIASSRIRYLIPCYLGIQLAIAHLFSVQITQSRQSRIWSGIAALVLTGSVVASVLNVQTDVTWIKSDKADYYLQIVEAINTSDRPLVISDSSPTYVLALSYRLNPTVHLELIGHPNQVEIPDEFESIFLFDPSPRLQRTLTTTQRYQLETVVKQNENFQLLKISR
ncbi:MAG: glycosyltransferase family 39 protein [Elainellaceae cyanobacterium]